ncbi:type 2 lanthipeptide synthetase LanM family protein [Longispora sp. K20-0274]|uniref:type 2 lanthipeptide synthetase LanM family protein n=1 Tax=Longispora sp. K20-0274 TaxID=3088255 RepID=UPI003999F97A
MTPWVSGLSLAERLALSGTPTLGTPVPDRAARRLDRWRAAHDLATSGQWHRRLAAVGLDEAGVLALLAEPPAALAARAAQPRWAVTVTALLETAPRADTPGPAPRAGRAGDAGAGSGPGDAGAVSWQDGFAAILDPFVATARERCLARIPESPIWDRAALVAGLTEALTGVLTRIACRTLVLELNVARVTGRLAGDTPEDRFASYVRLATRRDALTDLLGEYPVLARLLVQATDNAVDGYVELLDRLRADRPGLVAGLLGGVDPGPCVAVDTGGDAHRGGRSVAVLRFADGRSLVYKPRSLAVDPHFHGLVRWLCDRAPGLDLRTPEVLDRGTHGWAEFVEHRPLPGPPGPYYHRLGALLALVYALDGVDFHLENLIACGDQPVLVDVETLFHPPHRTGSVGETGLLPMPGLDLSGLCGAEGTPLPTESAVLAEAGTDAMRIDRRTLLTRGALNRPVADGVPVDARNFSADLLAGFRLGYTTLVAARTELLARLADFADDEVRVVIRPTHVYAMLLDESTHPDVLRDALDRDRILDHLWALSAGDPLREALIHHELRELWAGDVPVFTSRPGSRDLFTGVGARVRDVYPEPHLVRVSRKIAAMGPDDLLAQEKLIGDAMAEGENHER